MKDINELAKTTSFCMIPFMHTYGTAGGDIVPCCEAQDENFNEPGAAIEDTWNNDKYKELRRALTSNEIPYQCEVCWHNEASGVISNRQQWFEDDWDEYKDLIKLNDDYSVDNPPLWIELKVSNFCNLKCIMCSTSSSFKRVQDLDIIEKYMGSHNHETRLLRPTTLFESINEWDGFWDTVKVLQFTGGEPIINQEHYDLLESIPEHLRSTIKLRYATNLSHLTFKKYDLLEIWSQFEHVNIKVSLDGVNDVYDYIREGGDWSMVESNLSVLNDIENIDLALGITIQAHNIFQMPEFYEYWKQSKINLTFITANILQTPKILSPAVWPEPYRSAIITKLRKHESEHPEMDKFATYMENNQRDYIQYTKMRKYTRDLENRYNPKIKLSEMIEQYLDMPLTDFLIDINNDI